MIILGRVLARGFRLLMRELNFLLCCEETSIVKYLKRFFFVKDLKRFFSCEIKIKAK